MIECHRQIIVARGMALKSIQYLNSFIIKVILCLNIKVMSEGVEGTVVPEDISRGVEGYDCIAFCPGSAPIVF